MQIITLLTDINQKGFKDYLAPSCKYYDLDISVLHFDRSYNSHRLKDQMLYKHLKTLNKNEVIVFTDGYDTIFMAEEKEILSKFHAFNKPLVFSTEVNCWPEEKIKEEYPSSDYHFKYLNSGAFIGMASFIINLYENFDGRSLNPTYQWSNQYLWHHIYLANAKDIALDHGCSLFYNTTPLLDELKGLDFTRKDSLEIQDLYRSEKDRLEHELELIEGKYYCKITKSTPCHLHFPGPISKLLMPVFFDRIRPWIDVT